MFPSGDFPVAVITDAAFCFFSYPRSMWIQILCLFHVCLIQLPQWQLLGTNSGSIQLIGSQIQTNNRVEMCHSPDFFVKDLTFSIQSVFIEKGVFIVLINK